MVKKSITYFEKAGIENTDEVINLVQNRLKEGDVKSVVVASTSGRTGLKFAERLEKSFTTKFSGVSHSEVLAESLKSLFGPGMKVCVEIAIMALDGGAIPLEKTIAVGGTGANGRLEIIAKPSNKSNSFWI